MSVRLEKINEQIKLILAKVIHENYDPSFGMISITSVETAPDLKHAKIFISHYVSKYDIVELLNNDRKKLRQSLAQQIHIKFIPELKFCNDNSIEYAHHIENILRKIDANK